MNRRLLLALSLIIIVGISYAFFIFIFPTSNLFFEIIDRERGIVLFEAKIKPGDHFIIQYQHSVLEIPVYDVYVINDQCEITHTLTFTCNIPLDKWLSWFATEDDHTLVINDWIMIQHNVKEKISSLHLRVSTVSDHIIHFNGHSINLSSIAGPGGWIEVKISRKFLLKQAPTL